MTSTLDIARDLHDRSEAWVRRHLSEYAEAGLIVASLREVEKGSRGYVYKVRRWHWRTGHVKQRQQSHYLLLALGETGPGQPIRPVAGYVVPKRVLLRRSAVSRYEAKRATSQSSWLDRYRILLPSERPKSDAKARRSA